jgi:hypothetical protein
MGAVDLISDRISATLAAAGAGPWAPALMAASVAVISAGPAAAVAVADWLSVEAGALGGAG